MTHEDAFKAGYIKALSLTRAMVPMSDVDQDWRAYASDFPKRTIGKIVECLLDPHPNDMAREN